MTERRRFDALVIGASTRGLITAYVMSSLGYRAALIERGPVVGGGDGSFAAADGTLFEYGMHVLDEMRSRVATRLFTHVVDGAVNRVKLRRAIVLRNEIMPYAPRPSQMPEAIRRMLPAEELVDDLGEAAPTRAALEPYYGREFVDLIFDEVLPSYPCEFRHRAFGVDESELLANIYPWFFPRARRKAVSGDESRAFHDRLREGIDQHILYPSSGGFGGFCDGFLRHLDPERIEPLIGAGDFTVVLEPGTHRLRGVEVAGKRLEAEHYFWAAGWPELCRHLAIPCQDPATDRVVIGSFRLDRPASTDYHEILVGDPAHSINRIYFPGRFRESDDPLMQVEFAFPSVEPRSLDGEEWKRTWLEDLARLGVLDSGHRVEMFDFKTRKLHFNSYGMEGEKLVDADPTLLEASSNIFPVVPSMANLNLNAHVPRDVAYVISVLSGVSSGVSAGSASPLAQVPPG
jgi:hypothetical protein